MQIREHHSTPSKAETGRRAQETVLLKKAPQVTLMHSDLGS